MSNTVMQFDDDEPPPEAPREGYVLCRIHVPELDTYKCLQFPVDKLIWDVKQQVLASLPKELKESFNYGLFCPPANGKAGKFLDEERRLGDYPFNGPVGYLELKYKRRVYKMLNLDERQLRALHSRSNLRRFLECINSGQVEKVSKMCVKGLDPNFHCQETGETPLAMATSAKKPQKLLIALVNGGALLDYRTKDGSTPLHRAVERDCLEAVSTLLELGASPNYRDAKMLTPVYLSVTKKTDSKITEALLHDHAVLGTQDIQGWNEVHQACRNGLVHHLEHLLTYGGDMDSKNSTGNTPLHVCAVNNQEACARMLLFRGANRGALNYANQTPYQVAVIASNFELAEMIQNYKSEDIVPLRQPPRYNPRRRSGLGCWYNYHLAGSDYAGPTSSISSSSSWTASHYHTFARLMTNGPPSPCPSDQPFNSASSSLSESSSSHRSQEDDISIVTDKSLGDTSDIISDSSGVGTNSESATCSIGHPSTTVVAIEKYEAQISGHLSIQPGDVIEVVGSTDCGLLEGFIRGTSVTGFFPSHCAQEVQFRQKNITNVSTASSTNQQNIKNNNQVNIATTNGAEFIETNMQQYNSNTAPRAKKSFLMPEPRTVVLHRAKRGFGFVLRGAKAASPLMQLKPSSRCPALQYLDDVDPGGVADLSGLKPGDFLLSINDEDVTCASHEHVVEMIRNSSSVVKMTVLTMPINENLLNNNQPMVMSMMNGNGRQCSTLPRRMSGPNKMPAPAPPRRDPKTTLSVGRARARSMVAGLEGGDLDDDEILPKASSVESIHQQTQSALSTPTQGGPGTPIQPRTASIKCRPTSSRITAAELEDLFQRQQSVEAVNYRYSSMMTTSRFQSNCEASLTPQTSPSKAPLVYASIADMKRKKNKNGTLKGKPVSVPTVQSELRRNFHSSPDLANTLSGSATWTSGMLAKKGHLSQDDMHNIHSSMQRLNLPPPNHPPPPIPIVPVGQVIKVDVRKSEYESTLTIQKQIQAKQQQEGQEPFSSFKPAPKVYASPHELNIPQTTIVTSNEQNVTKISVTGASGNLNPYAQPGKAGVEPSLTPDGIPPPPPLPPAIPEPDYSMSESEEEADNSVRLASTSVPVTNNNNKNISSIPINQKEPAAETSGNSNTSGSSTGSSSMPHSFSVDEIQRIRTQLKSSKSFPNAFKDKDKDLDEHPECEGDNSSSGVSSDQEIMINSSAPSPPKVAQQKISITPKIPKREEPLKKEVIISTEDAPSDEDSPPITGFQRNNSMTRKQAAIIAANRARALSLSQKGEATPVSLTQLPPPIEADSDDEVDSGKLGSAYIAPPPEFGDIVSSTRSLHIPTQPSQMLHRQQQQHPPPSHYMIAQQQQMQYMLNQQQQRSVRIVGALPKQNVVPGQMPMVGKVVHANHPHHHIHHYHHSHPKHH